MEDLANGLVRRILEQVPPPVGEYWARSLSILARLAGRHHSAAELAGKVGLEIDQLGVLYSL
jgi:hypothetical protein